MAMQGHLPTSGHDPLWEALQRMQIEPAGAEIAFAAKLARDNGWDRPFAEAVAAEYRRFLYLAATADSPVSPSEAVDRAWHLHLTYSRHYWEELCGRILGRPLHHDPSLGGAAEDERHRGQYAATLARYRDTFGQEPPAAVWPSGTPAPGRAPRLAALAGGAGLTMLLAACAAAAAASGERSSGDNQLIGWLAIGAVFVIVVALVRRNRKRRGARPGRGRRSGAAASGCGTSYGSSDSDTSSCGSSDGGSSCGGGGCGGGGD